MKEESKTGVVRDLVLGGGRYVIGLLFLISGPLTLVVLGKDPSIMLHAIVHPMLTFVVTPQIAIGLYFMLTGIWRPRVDFTLFLIVLFLTYAFYSFAVTFSS